MVFDIRFPVIVSTSTGSTRPLEHDVVLSVSARNRSSALKKIGELLTEIAKPKRKKRTRRKK